MPPSSQLLVTGFEPFNGVQRNPSAELVCALAKTHDMRSMITEVIPVEYEASFRRFKKLVHQHQPAAWIGFGLNQRAGSIMLERIAVNLDDATIADNAGELRRGQPIDSAGAETYRSTLPIEQISAALCRQNIPTAFSDSAGRFVCNHVFYRAMNLLGRSNPPAIGGFIHIPWPSDWPCDWEHTTAARHTVTLATIIDAAQVCITTILHELRTQKFDVT
jgi:pyroglutamyl-peptidase